MSLGPSVLLCIPVGCVCVCPCVSSRGCVSLCGPMDPQLLSPAPCVPAPVGKHNLPKYFLFFFLSFFVFFFFSSSRIPSKNSPRGLFSLFTKIEFFFPSHPPFFSLCFCFQPLPLPLTFHQGALGQGCPHPSHVSLFWGFLNLLPPLRLT